MVLSFPSTIPHCNKRAQAPATTADAAELPENVVTPPPTFVVRIFTPIVEISGLIKPFVLNPFPDAAINALLFP